VTTPSPLGLLKNENNPRSDFAYISGTARDPNAPPPPDGDARAARRLRLQRRDEAERRRREAERGRWRRLP